MLPAPPTPEPASLLDVDVGSSTSSPSLENIAVTVNEFIEHTNDKFAEVMKRIDNLRNDMQNTDEILSNVIGTSHRHDFRLAAFESKLGIAKATDLPATGGSDRIRPRNQ